MKTDSSRSGSRDRRADMLKIDSMQNITLTRGDAATFKLELEKDGEEYVVEEGDTIRFAMSKEYLNKAGYELIREKAITLNDDDELEFSLSSEDTKIDYGTYNYDIEITHSDGKPDTIISAQFEITGEVK